MAMQRVLCPDSHIVASAISPPQTRQKCFMRSVYYSLTLRQVLAVEAVHQSAGHERHKRHD